MQFSTKTILAFAAIVLPLVANASPLQPRSGCREADDAPPGSIAQQNAIVACQRRGASVDGVNTGDAAAPAAVAPAPVAAPAEASGGFSALDANGCLTTCGPGNAFYTPGCQCEQTCTTPSQCKN